MHDLHMARLDYLQFHKPLSTIPKFKKPRKSKRKKNFNKLEVSSFDNKTKQSSPLTHQLWPRVGSTWT